VDNIKEVTMKVTLTLNFLAWTRSFTWGNPNAKYAIVELAGTILTIGIAFSVKV
jgi:hypothetical protein